MDSADISKLDEKKIENVLSGQIREFIKIVEILKFSPQTSFRFADLSCVDFGNSDLSGYDFTESDLRGADFTNSQLSEAVLPDGETADSLRAHRKIGLP